MSATEDVFLVYYSCSMITFVSKWACIPYLCFYFLTSHNSSQIEIREIKRLKKNTKMYLISFHCFEALFIQIKTCFPSYISFQKAIILQMLSFSLKTSLDRKLTPQTSIHKRRHGYWTLLSTWWLWKFDSAAESCLPVTTPLTVHLCDRKNHGNMFVITSQWDGLCMHTFVSEMKRRASSTQSLGKSKLIVKRSFMHVCSKLSVMLSY